MARAFASVGPLTTDRAEMETVKDERVASVAPSSIPDAEAPGFLTKRRKRCICPRTSLSRSCVGRTKRRSRTLEAGADASSKLSTQASHGNFAVTWPQK